MGLVQDGVLTGDCCVLPTRFVGESYPLTIIEAILAGIPTVATDMGEIKSILGIDREPMGIVVQREEDDAAFCESVTQAMQCMLHDGLYNDLRTSVLKNQDAFSVDKLVDDDVAIYQRVLSGQVKSEAQKETASFSLSEACDDTSRAKLKRAAWRHSGAPSQLAGA